MKRDAFIRALRGYARSNNLAFSFDTSKGKGGHSKVKLANRITTVKDGELSNVYIEVVLKQLGLPKDVLDNAKRNWN